MNGTIQKKKDTRSDFQGLIFMFECSVMIISSHLFNRKDSHTTKTDLHSYGIFNTGNSESCLSSSIVGHTSPAGVCKRVEALQVSHDFKTSFEVSSERKITMTRNKYHKLDNILGYY